MLFTPVIFYWCYWCFIRDKIVYLYLQFLCYCTFGLIPVSGNSAFTFWFVISLLSNTVFTVSQSVPVKTSKAICCFQPLLRLCLAAHLHSQQGMAEDIILYGLHMDKYSLFAIKSFTDTELHTYLCLGPIRPQANLILGFYCLWNHPL